jgi:hypothetical protein
MRRVRRTATVWVGRSYDRRVASPARPEVTVGSPALAALALAVVLSVVVLTGATAAQAPAPPQPFTGPASAAVEPPAGGLVDSEANFGWTTGKFSVSQDGAAQYSVPLSHPRR